MQDQLIGRRFEQEQLQKAFVSDCSEFVAIYGRRRIGKTFLVTQFFSKKPCVFFYVSGVHHGGLQIQLEEFKKQVEQVFYGERKGTQLKTPANWMEALAMLSDAIEIFAKRKKVVLFFDEFPWMVTPKSHIITHKFC